MSPHCSLLSSTSQLVAAVSLFMLPLACIETPGPNSADEGDAGPVVLLAERVQLPDSRLIYVTLHEGVPTAVADRSRAYEFGNVDIFTNAGAVFIHDRESVTVTRYQVTAARELVEDTLADGSPARMSFQTLGLRPFGFEHVFVDEQHAFLVDWGDYRLIGWNPSTMELDEVKTLDVAAKEGFPLDESYLVSPLRAGDNIHIGIYAWQDYNALEAFPGSGVVTIPVDGQARLLEDNRVVGAAKLFPDEAGRVLVVGDQYSGCYGHFGPGADNAPPAGVLRLNEDATGFDDDYFVDLLAVTGSPAVYASYQVDGRTLLLQAWDPETAMTLTNVDDYWAAEEYVYLLVDLETQQSQRVTSIAKAGAGSVEQFRLDNQLYVQVYGESPSGDRESRVLRVTPDGATEQFPVPGGDLWTLKRVR